VDSKKLLSEHFEDEIRTITEQLAKDVVEKETKRITKEEIDQIVEKLIPFIDKMISKWVLKHLIYLLTKGKEVLKEKGE